MVAVCDRCRVGPVGGYRSGLLRRKLGTVADWCALDCARIAGRTGRKYANTDPKKRPHSFINPTIAVYTLVLAKALGLAGATLAGWYGGQIVVSLSHIEADFYAHAVTECAIAAVVCIADMIIGIIGEWLCQLPPNEGPENPKIREAKRRSDIAQAYKR